MDMKHAEPTAADTPTYIAETTNGDIQEAMLSYSIRIPQQLALQISELAMKDDRTWSWMVRRILERGLEQFGVQPYRAPGMHLT